MDAETLELETVDFSIMADCIAADIPILLASPYGHNPAQAYVTGGWPIEWSEHQIMLFPRHMRTAQQPSPLIDDGSPARELDVERWAATAADWPDFWHTRTDKERATCYQSISTLPSVVGACHEAGIPMPNRLRVAWWWQNPADGSPLPDDARPEPPTAEQVLEEIQRLTGLVIPARVLWACQYVHYENYDLTKVYGALDYARS